MRFRKNRRMEPKPSTINSLSAIAPATADQPSTQGPVPGALPLDDAGAALVAEGILAELWNEFAISATLKVKTNLNRAAEREFNRLKLGHKLKKATVAPGHAVAKLGAPGTNPLRNAEAKAKAETMFMELWREFEPDAVAAILQHFNRAHDREVKGQTVRKQVERSQGN